MVASQFIPGRDPFGAQEPFDFLQITAVRRQSIGAQAPLHGKIVQKSVNEMVHSPRPSLGRYPLTQNCSPFDRRDCRDRRDNDGLALCALGGLSKTLGRKRCFITTKPSGGSWGTWPFLETPGGLRRNRLTGRSEHRVAAAAQSCLRLAKLGLKTTGVCDEIRNKSK